MTHSGLSGVLSETAKLIFFKKGKNTRTPFTCCQNQEAPLYTCCARPACWLLLLAGQQEPGPGKTPSGGPQQAAPAPLPPTNRERGRGLWDPQEGFLLLASHTAGRQAQPEPRATAPPHTMTSREDKDLSVRATKGNAGLRSDFLAGTPKAQAVRENTQVCWSS